MAGIKLFRVNLTNIGLSIEAPEGWQAGGTADFQVLLAAPAEQDYNANLGINQIQSRNATVEMLENELNNIDQQQAQQYQSYKQTALKKETVDGAPARLQFYEWLHPESGLFFSQLRALILRDPDTLYVVSGSSLKQLEKQYIPLMEHLISSIKFL